MTAFYNEIDPEAAETIRELIKAGEIPQGHVDERDIRDIRPAELRPYAQVHLYAGCAVWAHALRLAGWPDNRPVWTFSEPCQPFSAAGKGLGDADERYLRPATHHLVRHGKPRGVPCYGEQVASSDGLIWLDTLCADMEGTGHTIRPFDLCAAGFGAPHIRQRLYFVAYAQGSGGGAGLCDRGPAGFGRIELADGRGDERLEHLLQPRLEGQRGNGDDRNESGRDGAGEAGSVAAPSAFGILDNPHARGFGKHGHATGDRAAAGIAHAEQHGGHDPLDHTQSIGPCSGGYRNEGGAQPAPLCGGQEQGGGRAHNADAGSTSQLGYSGCERDEFGGKPRVMGCAPDKKQGKAQKREWRRDAFANAGQNNNRPGPLNGHWRNADWLLCRDGKWRPVEAGTFPLASGIAARVGRLRMYGNCINAQQAAHFIKESGLI